MKVKVMRELCLLAAAVSVAGWDHLNEHEFLRTVGGHNQALIAFVEPSTTASQALEPEWSSISVSEKTLGSVDCTSQIQLCKDYDIISYPSIRYFDGHGKMTPYRGPRTGPLYALIAPCSSSARAYISFSIVSFLRRASRPTVTLLDERKITAFQSIDDAVVVAHLNARDTHIQEAFKSLASRFKDRASFGSLETTEQTTIVCYNNRDNEQSTTSDLAAIDSLPSFVSACMTPLIGEFSRRNEVKYFQSGKSLVYFFAETREEREAYVNVIKPIAKKYKEFLSFVTVDADEYRSMTSPLGLPSGLFPALAVQNPTRGQVFPFTEEHITVEAVDNFVMDIAGGKVKPWTSLPVPDRSSHAHDEL
ncbi:uncharacterized protein JN550_012936 [Neoarthrinium moseri]|uniref:uncharacterized protein n=1 Tax=Neoarthrinium moseri TaxID=1658444 RepID=UPI001FDDCE7F|nr:uncharacterized protein JN550_012936 [Neoarthrinium moseri]KAI1858043.1 hypothetical protein JN550_012936 [Neoarthrinium moseri]